MAIPLVPSLVAIVALLGCSAFFSSSETALFSLSREWLTEAVRNDTRTAEVKAVLADPNRLLVTFLMGNDVVNITPSRTC